MMSPCLSQKYLYLYLNTVLTEVFAIVFVFGKFIVFQLQNIGAVEVTV